jgi:hypothetical protein
MTLQTSEGSADLLGLDRLHRVFTTPKLHDGGRVKVIQSGGVKLIRPYVQWSPILPFAAFFGASG